MNRIMLILWGGICFILSFLSFLSFDYFRSKYASQAPETAIGFEDKGVILFLEAVSRIREEGLFWNPGEPETTIFQDSLKSYLAGKDPFSDYLTREEFLRFRQLQEEQYVGIGMEIERDPHGRIICFPYPGSPAGKKGIIAGDYLRRINGIPVNGKSVFTVAFMASGPIGTTIRLVVAGKSGVEKELAVVCGQLQIKRIRKRWLGGFPIIQIHAFTRSTNLKLGSILQSWDKTAPVIIDLRGNSGGDLAAAIKSAEFFLDKGQRILTIETRTGSTAEESRSPALDLAYPVYLWQDATTASAAEVFIAALTDNRQAVSIGKTTFGKGTKQDIIRLSDGSALILTTGRLKTPNGTGYQGRGLNPVYQLKKDFIDTADYLSKVKEISLGDNDDW
ncbi:MAG: hypothetical protein GY737_26580 [Desulfobacteraceae bacterium]|nr:hypothetical protein [Desulfobacteraceae bacterium]